MANKNNLSSSHPTCCNVSSQPYIECTKVHLLGYNRLSLLISGHAVCTVASLQCTCAGAAISWAVAAFMDGVCDNCRKSLGLFVVSWLKVFAFTQCLMDSSGPWANPNPNLIHRPSHLTRPVIKCVIPVANGAKYSDYPVHISMVCPSMLSITMSTGE